MQQIQEEAARRKEQEEATAIAIAKEIKMQKLKALEEKVAAEQIQNKKIGEEMVDEWVNATSTSAGMIMLPTFIW